MTPVFPYLVQISDVVVVVTSISVQTGVLYIPLDLLSFYHIFEFVIVVELILSHPSLFIPMGLKRPICEVFYTDNVKYNSSHKRAWCIRCPDIEIDKLIEDAPTAVALGTIDPTVLVKGKEGLVY